MAKSLNIFWVLVISVVCLLLIALGQGLWLYYGMKREGFMPLDEKMVGTDRIVSDCNAMTFKNGVYASPTGEVEGYQGDMFCSYSVMPVEAPVEAPKDKKDKKEK